MNKNIDLIIEGLNEGKSIKYKGVEITQKGDSFYLKSPVNGTQRIFRSLELAKNYVDNADALDSHARAMSRNPW